MSLKTSLQVHLLQENESVVLPEPLLRSVGFVGLDPWMTFVHRVYDFPIYRFASQFDREIVGWLALARVQHPLFGDFLTTSPFGSYGGFAYSSIASRDALLGKARELANDLRVQYVNVRFAPAQQTPPEGCIQDPIYATYYVDLSPDVDALMSAYSSDHRNHIRKSLKKGFSIKFSRLELLEDVYEGLAHSMHELGSPYHNKAYLHAMAGSLGEALEFVVLYGPNGELAGAGVFISQGDVVTNLHANILRRFRPDYAGEFLYWSAIERYSQKGCQVFDLGRSLIGSGNEAFKMKWKPRRQALAYWYVLMPGQILPQLNQQNPKFRLAIWAWKHMPAFVVRALGPSLIRGFA